MKIAENSDRNISTLRVSASLINVASTAISDLINEKLRANVSIFNAICASS